MKAVGADLRVELCPDGPMLLRGAKLVVDDSGTSHQVLRPVVALCRCGMSGRSPWCDGSHKFLPPNRAGKNG